MATTLESKSPLAILASAMITGGPPRAPNPYKDYKYYLCEMKFNGWKCSRKESEEEERATRNSPGTLVTKGVLVPKWVPSIADRAYIWAKLTPNVFPLNRGCG